MKSVPSPPNQFSPVKIAGMHVLVTPPADSQYHSPDTPKIQPVT
jgi:hypothetical protein